MNIFLRVDINLISIILLGLVFLIAFPRLDRTDVRARLCGDEFVIIVSKSTEAEQKNMIHDIELALSVYNENANKTYLVGCSFGHGIYNEKLNSTEHFISLLDHRMYVNKSKQ